MSPKSSPRPYLWSLVLVILLEWLWPAMMLVTGQRWIPLLPSHVASHWSGIDLPNDTASTIFTWWLALVFTVVGALIATVGLLLPLDEPETRRWTTGIGGFISALSVAFWFVPAYVTLQAGDPMQAHLGMGLLFIIMMPLYAIIPVLFLRHRGDSGLFPIVDSMLGKS